MEKEWSFVGSKTYHGDRGGGRFPIFMVFLILIMRCALCAPVNRSVLEI